MTTMLFQSPGAKTRPDGTYGWKIFDDADVESALESSRHRTPREAIEAAAKPKRGRPRKQTRSSEAQEE